MNSFDRFCSRFLATAKIKSEQAKGFLWFEVKSSGKEEVEVKAILGLFEKASLPVPSITRIREYFSKDREVHKGKKSDVHKLTRSALEKFDKEFGSIFVEPTEEVEIVVKTNVKKTPLLTEAEIGQAFEMAQMYVILHCYENSARKLIEKVLSAKLGSNWWDIAASNPLKTKLKDRQEKEAKNKWLTPRGNSPLFYIDWGDLLSIIRKYEPDFLPHIHDFKFAELRFEELERLRNVVAHHGFFPAEEDFQRLLISFNDWTKQVS